MLSAIALLVAAGCYSGSRPARIGDAAKDFTVQDSDRTVTLNQFHGQVLVLNFWATWCPPCVEEIPSLMDMQERTKAKGVVVLGISIDVDGDAYHRFLKQHQINFMTVRDPEEKIADHVRHCGLAGNLYHRPPGRDAPQVCRSGGLEFAGCSRIPG